MPCVAPGEVVRGARRRKFLESIQAQVTMLDQCLAECLYSLKVDTGIHPPGRNPPTGKYFTLPSSGFGVERGCLGEVVSLVGDCRPPPPGNPRRPTPEQCVRRLRGEHSIQNGKSYPGGPCFTSKHCKDGEIDRPDSQAVYFRINHPSPFCPPSPALGGGAGGGGVGHYVSVLKPAISGNLKELAFTQYFKNNRSYFSCLGYEPVLEFVHACSHLCGLERDIPPSIAITNVLIT